MYELQNLPSDGVKWKPAKIDFPGYEEYRIAAGEIAEFINSIELTSDNVKEVKKVLADARKVTDGLNKERINIKKAISTEYKDFESMVNSLIAIIDNADAKLRDKVRGIEEAEREAKREKIIDIWNKRVKHYRIDQYFPDAYSLWLTPQHLNKSMSMKNVEADMTEWLEDTERAFETLDGMDDEYTVEYLNCWDLGTAIKTVNERERRRELISGSDDESVMQILIRGEKDITLTKLLLKENCINYEVL